MPANHTPLSGMKPVTKEAFFAAIGPTDTMPRVDVASFKGRYHRSIWETSGRAVVGESFSDSHGSEPTVFFLRA